MSKQEQTPDVFDTQVTTEKAIESAKRTWQYNYSTIVAVLKAVGKLPEDATKIDDPELEKAIKFHLLDHAKEIVSKQEEKKANGMPF